jgi:hypothetical protein
MLVKTGALAELQIHVVMVGSMTVVDESWFANAILKRTQRKREHRAKHVLH